MTEPEGYEKVLFRLPPEGDGWPPVSVEGMWAERVQPNVYRIANAPWFVRNLAVGDLVRTEPGDDGAMWVVQRLRPSGRLTVWVAPSKEGPLKGNVRSVLEAFAGVGVAGESVDEQYGQVGEPYGLIALDIPANVPLRPIWDLLMKGFDLNWWGFDEGCVNTEWRSFKRAKS